jgi:hypothetical protein
MIKPDPMEQYEKGLEYRRGGKWDKAREYFLTATLLMLREPGDGAVRQRRIEVALQMRELARDCGRKAEEQAFCERVVRAWLNTISHDLCIRPPSITISTQCDGLYGPAGGAFDPRNYCVTIPAIYTEERDIVEMLCHELRHAFNYANRIPQTKWVIPGNSGKSAPLDDHAPNALPAGVEFSGRINSMEAIASGSALEV